MLSPPSGFSAGKTLGLGPAATSFEVIRNGQHFVCKRLSLRGRRDSATRQAFLDESRLLKTLAGRGAPVLVLDGDDFNGPFFVMERLAMRSLRDWRLGTPASDAPPPPLTDAAWIEAATRASFRSLVELQNASDESGPLNVIHGDLSPSNIMIGKGGTEAKFVDFGMSHWRDAKKRKDGVFRGTLLYAAPELARGEPIDNRSDLFSLAAALLHAACGKPPRTASSQAALLATAAERPIDSWAKEASNGLPRPLAQALVACVEFDKNNRPANAVLQM